jgi:uncharacterized membrane protein YphA (DoxX/SURF4 family)
VSSHKHHKPSQTKGFWARLGAITWLVVGARCLVGAVFILAGFSKLLLPHAEVMAQMQQYPVLPQTLLPVLATVLPWIELSSGTALAIGWYTTPAACLVGLQLIAFSVLMVVVLAAGINIEDCGCFGQLGLHETPAQVLIRDLILIALLGPVLARQSDAIAFDGLQPGPDMEEKHQG